MCLLLKYGEDSDCKYKRDGREREEPRLTMVRTKPNHKRRKEEEEKEDLQNKSQSSKEAKRAESQNG